MSQARLKDDISEEYKVWKADTLAKQTGHMETGETEIQKPEIQIQHRDNRDRDSFEIQIAPGYR